MTSERPSRQARGEAKRREILVATLALVRSGGIAAATSRSVAKEAGVPLGSLSYYFDGQDDLLQQALLLHVDEEVERMRAISDTLAAAEDVDPIRAAQAFREALGQGDVATIAQFELYLEAGRNPALREAAARCFAAYEEVVTTSLTAAGLPDAESVAPLFVAFSDGLGLRQLAAPEGAMALDEGLLRIFGALVAQATPTPGP
ncbi:MAG: TetR family transcriptional regulator [Solirubrobacteraceae bacterium]|nr:TetR family transcriptional regulator [Solirubrobacteraceae bacterium]